MNVATEKTGNILIDAGLNFEVEKKPHYVQQVTRDGVVYSESALSCGIFRTDNGEEIGDVGKAYEVAQTDEILRPFIEAAHAGHMQYKSGMAIGGGRRFDLTFNVGEKRIVHGEKIQHQIIVGGSHDGSWSTFIKDRMLREVCTNGLMGLQSVEIFRIRHTTNWKSRYGEVLRGLEQSGINFNRSVEIYNSMFNIAVPPSGITHLTNKLLGIVDVKDADLSGRKRNQRDKIIELSRQGKGIKGNREILNTGAAWYNAVAEYYDHYTNTSNDEKQHVSSNFGSGATKKKHAAQLVLSM
jgi:phage/plasmid-like protein (TIGR03299 family)